MKPEDIGRIRSSFSLVVPVADEAVADFYDRLFDRSPGLRPMFPADLTEQRKKLISMLATVVGGLENIHTLLPVLQDLGARHVGYGVEPDHYDIVGAALLETLEAALGGDWTPEVAAAWKQAYGVLSGAMLEGAAGVNVRVA